MVDTALTLITDALLDLGVLADEETPTASQAAGALRKLNNMIDAWNIESLMVYGANSYTLPLVPGQGVYTIGPTGNLNIPRPALIQSAYLRDTLAPVEFRQDLPLYIATDHEWQDVAFKSQTASYPFNTVWFDYAFPLVKAYVNPIPTTNQYSLILWASALLNNLTLYDPIILSPGYKRALTANLSIELAPSYQVQVPDTIARIAMDSKMKIKMNNVQVDEMDLPIGLSTGYYDIRTNRYR